MKKTATTIIILVIVALGIYFLFIGNGGTEELTLEGGLNPITLTDEEKNALKTEGLTIPEDNKATEKLRTVQSSNQLNSIEEDLNGTNFMDMDKELAELEKLLGDL